MKKTIKLLIENSAGIKQLEDIQCELYSHDRNNGLFVFEILNDKVTTENVVALFSFVDSEKVWRTTGICEDRTIKVNFDTELITRDEQVNCYLYLDSEEHDCDVFKFKFEVKVSEIDKVKDLPVKERFLSRGLIVDRTDVLTKEVLDEELEKIKSKFIVKTDLEGLAKSSEIPDVSGFVRSTDLEGYAKSTEIPDISGFVKDTALETLKTEILKEVDDEGFLKQHQSLEGLLTKDALDKKLEDVVSKIPQPNLTDYVTTNALNEKLKDVVSKLPQPDLSGYVKEQTFNDFKATLNTSGSELRGNGIPYGKAAKIGTIYIDEDVTNGAMRWLKTKDSWKVVDGDTGWVDVPLRNAVTGTKMQLRRVNNLVNVRFFNEKDEGLAKFTNLYSSDPTTHYLMMFNGAATFGWRPTQKVIQMILPEVSQGGTDYAYNSSQSPHPFLRLSTKNNGLVVEIQLDEFTVSNNNLGVYINTFSYLTDDDWPISLNVI